jgi:hypothetical protein
LLGDDPVERAGQERELFVAPDHRGSESPAHDAWDGQEPDRRHGLAFALEGERLDRLCRNRSPYEGVGALPDEDLAWPGNLLESGCNVDCIARREPLLAHGIAGDDLAAVDTDTNLDADAVLTLELCVQGCERAAHLDRGAHGTQRVVLTHDGDAEDGHHRVADELLDLAAVTLDDRAHRLEVAADDHAERLCIEAFTEGRRADDVDEDHGDRLARRLARRRAHRQRRGAGEAEPGDLGVLLAAGAANGHEIQCTTVAALLPEEPA